ncbi:MAG: hypothetical protein Q9220_004288 [cf. Caloplaca sp. 1 TL-2023]
MFEYRTPQQNPSSVTPPQPHLDCSLQDPSSCTPPPQKLSSFNTRYAHQGLGLLQTSLQETNQDPQFSRRVYIHALVYLLQGLQEATYPLSGSEAMDLRAALPPSINLTTSGTADSQASAGAEESERPRYLETTTSSPPQPQHHLSLLHRTFSLLAFTVVLLTTFLLPHIRALISTLAYYDKEYDIHTRLAGFAARCARSTWAFAIYTLDPEVMAWVVMEGTNGVQDGWRRAMDDEERRKAV